MLEGNLIESEFHPDTMPEYHDEENPDFFQITFQDGTIINQSESMEEEPLEVPSLNGDPEDIENMDLTDGESGRYILIRAKPIKEEEVDEEEEVEADEIIFEIPENINPEEATVTIFVATSRENLDGTLFYLYFLIGGIDLLVLSGICLLVSITIRKGMAPVDEINRQIKEIDGEDLEKRIDLVKPPSELYRIVHTLNELLERMDKIITRERRFTSDVAHELRTPVSELRTASEVALMSAEDPEETKAFFEDVGDISRQMEKIVNNLLTLSRWDQDEVEIHREEVALKPMIDECWTRFSKEAESKDIQLDCHVEENSKIFTDREKFEMIVQNLIENAIAYSVPGSHIRCRMEPGNPSVTLIIENQAANLCRQDVEFLFDRFWRKDRARSEVNHSGLGLSIVKALADILTIQVLPELLEDQWFRMQLKIRI